MRGEENDYNHIYIIYNHIIINDDGKVNSDVESIMSKLTHQEELVGRTLPPPRPF